MDISKLMDKNNFVFLGEAGSGKSEIAINLALELARLGTKPVHFFDLDMTKPLFRSRDLKDELEKNNVIVHFEEQFMDAPTTTGWVTRALRDSEAYVVMDVGGDYIGARAVGGYAPSINRDNTVVYYVVNPFRPWSLDMEHIDHVLGQILGVSHIQLKQLKLLGNPNLGIETNKEDIEKGIALLKETVECYQPLEGICMQEKFAEDFAPLVAAQIWPIHLYLTYEWLNTDVSA